MTARSTGSGTADHPFCAYCGGEVPPMAAMVYHGVVYHPACLLPTTRRERSSETAGEGGESATEGTESTEGREG